MANQKYTSIQNDYSIVFDKNSTIEQVPNDTSIQQQAFCFISLAEINEFESMRTIDGIGVVTFVGPSAQVSVKHLQNTVKDRRNLVIAEESGLCITVSLWGANATLSYEVGQVLALKGARVSDYNGKSLNSGDEHSQVFVNPENKRAQELRKWWEVSGLKGVQELRSMSGGSLNLMASAPQKSHAAPFE